MRITETMFSNSFLQQANNLQEAMATNSSQISSGMSIINPGDDPVAFGQVSALRQQNSQNAVYTSTTNTLSTTAQSTYNVLTQMQTLATSITSLMTQASSTGSANYADYGQQLQTYADQLAQLVNTQVNGVYIFGGTGNQAPLVAITPTPSSDAPQYQLNNTSAGYVSNVTTAAINSNLTVSIGLTAGSNTSGASNFGGFLTDGSGVDFYTMVASAAQDLLNASSGTSDPFSADTNLGSSYSNAVSAINAGADNISRYLGRASSQLAVLTNNQTDLATAATTQTTTLDSLTSADTATLATQLSTLQTAYSASLQSAATILKLNMLDYIS
ncbi:MAG: hypothetical protein PW734_10020 [Verrucomicrobium sp.]|nr:hypothetical protein [Verrucomicrobium sp.]